MTRSWGSLRIWEDIRYAEARCGCHRVARLMRRAGRRGCRDMSSSRGEVRVMPQAWFPDRMPLKSYCMTCRTILTKGQLLLARTNACVLNEWPLSLDVQRSRPWKAPQASKKCGLHLQITSVSVPAGATASIRNMFLAPSPNSRSHRSLHRNQHEARKGSWYHFRALTRPNWQESK